MPTKEYTIATQQYVIHDRPNEQLPVRRLQNEGGDVLSVNELLQISLGKVDGLQEIVKEYGVHFLTTLHSVPDIVESLNIDHLQATRLLAILSLGKRLYGESQGSLIQVRGIEDVYQQYRSMAHLTKEQLRVLLINSRYQLVHEETLAIGSTEYLHIHPRDVYQSAVERRVSAVILIHNHPSGDPTPSETDIEFTKQICEAGKILGIELLDHVIIGKDSSQSCLSVKAD